MGSRRSERLDQQSAGAWISESSKRTHDVGVDGIAPMKGSYQRGTEWPDAIDATKVPSRRCRVRQSPTRSVGTSKVDGHGSRLARSWRRLLWSTFRVGPGFACFAGTLPDYPRRFACNGPHRAPSPHRPVQAVRRPLPVHGRRGPRDAQGARADPGDLPRRPAGSRQRGPDPLDRRRPAGPSAHRSAIRTPPDVSRPGRAGPR